MSDFTYLPIDVQEISKAEYYEARKDPLMLIVNKPYGFIWSRGATRTLYVTHDGKFYRGDVRPGIYSDDIATFDFTGVDFRAPQAVFKRKPVLANANKPKLAAAKAK